MKETHHNPGEEEIFGIARVIASKEHRIKYLDQVCSGDPKMRQSVDELLSIYDLDQSFLESPPPDVYSPDSSPIKTPGTMIGPYKILEAIGQGGMGNVYMAEQVEPVHRKVALKVIKTGMDSKSVIARFEAERQALALMDHPNIAKFYDAGISDSGSPYFVMELVKGRPIIEYCQLHILDVNAKLQLFAQVCQGVQHAHQKGVIHRDLKPSNVLVARYDDQPVAKVIDFGVAKAIGEKLTDKTMFTRFGQLVGTLEYMSPEQAQFNQLDVDTRSDVYSLGAILYELLTGEPPFERERLSSAALEEVLRIIREDEPSKPSTRLSSLSTVDRKEDFVPRRSSQKLTRTIPADLDWIVMKCLEKDRARRYASTSDLFQDVLRYLSNEPVSAGPPNSIYRLKKFVRRNQAAVFVSSVLAASLLLGIGVSTWQAVRASRAEQSVKLANKELIKTLSELKSEKEESDQQRENAETEQRRATAFLNYIVDTFKSPLSADRADVRVIDMLHVAAENVESKFHDDPVVAARILESIAETFTFMKRGEDAIPVALRAREILKDNLGPKDPEVLKAFCYVYWAYHESPQFGAHRMRLCQEILKVHEICTQELEEDDPTMVPVQLVLADAYAHNPGNGSRDEVIAQVLKTANQWKNNPDRVEEYEMVLDSVAGMFLLQKEHEQSLRYYQELNESLSQHLPEKHLRRLAARAMIADVQSRLGEHASAIMSSRELLATFETSFGKVDRLTIYRRVEHSVVLARSGDASAKAVAAQATAEAQQNFENSTLHLYALDHQAEVHWDLDDIDKAIELVRLRTELAPDFSVLWRRYDWLKQQNKHQAAIQLLEAVIPFFEGRTATQDEDQTELDRQVVLFKYRVSAAYFYLKNHDKTAEWLESALSTSDLKLGEDSKQSRQLLRYMIYYNRIAGRYAAADKVAREHMSRIRKYYSNDAMIVADGLAWAGLCSFDVKKPDKAIANFREYLDVVHHTLGHERGQPFTVEESFDYCREDNGEGLLTYENSDVRFLYISVVGALANSYLQIGELENAIPLAETSLNFYFDIKTKNPTFAQESKFSISAGASIKYLQADTTNDSELSETASQLIVELVPQDWTQDEQQEKYKGAANFLSLAAANLRNASHSEQKWEGALVLERLGYCRLKSENFESAQRTLEEFFSVANDELVESYVGYLARHELGAVLINLENAEGEVMFLEGAEQLWDVRTKLETHQRWYLLEVLQRVVDYYVADDNQDIADHWRARRAEFEKPGLDQ